MLDASVKREIVWRIDEGKQAGDILGGEVEIVAAAWWWASAHVR